MGSGGKRYDQAQVAQILRKAAELAQSSGKGSSSSVSLEELIIAAREMGLPEDSVTQAASMIETTPQSAWYRVADAKFTRPIDRPVSDDDWRDSVRALRGSFGGVGREERDGDSVLWMSDDGSSIAELWDMNHDPTVRVRTDIGGLRVITMFMLFGPSVLGLSILTAIVKKAGLNPYLGVAIGALLLTLGALARWGFLKSAVNRRFKHLSDAFSHFGSDESAARSDRQYEFADDTDVQRIEAR